MTVARVGRHSWGGRREDIEQVRRDSGNEAIVFLDDFCGSNPQLAETERASVCWLVFWIAEISLVKQRASRL